MRSVKPGLVAFGVGVVIVLAAAAAITGLVVLRRHPPAEYPADPADQPPAAEAFDLGTLITPGCPTGQPDPAPAAPGRAGSERLVEWGAVRIVRCTYFDPVGYDLERIDAIEDRTAVTEATRVLRRMLTAAQYTAYFGPMGTGINAMKVPWYRYLFQFPDGHVTEVDEREGYHRDDIVRYRWSVRGTSIAPLAVPGDRACGQDLAATCRLTDSTATIPT